MALRSRIFLKNEKKSSFWSDASLDVYKRRTTLARLDFFVKGLVGILKPLEFDNIDRVSSFLRETVDMFSDSWIAQ